MTQNQKAHELVTQFKIILMLEETECGNEILCTCIAIKMAKITIKEILEQVKTNERKATYWEQVLEELNTI